MAGTIGRLGLGSVAQQQRRHIAAAKSGIGDPARSVELDQAQRVGARRGRQRIGQRIPPQPDPGQQRAAGKAQFAEHGIKQCVVFEAITPAPAAQFGPYGRQIDRDRAPQRHVEVLEANRQAMRPVDLG